MEKCEKKVKHILTDINTRVIYSELGEIKGQTGNSTLSRRIIWLKMKIQLKFAAMDRQFNSKLQFWIEWVEIPPQFKIIILSWRQSNAANTSLNFILNQMIRWESEGKSRDLPCGLYNFHVSSPL